MDTRRGSANWPSPPPGTRLGLLGKAVAPYVTDGPAVNVVVGGLDLVKKLPGLLTLLKEDRSYLKEPGS